MEKITFLLTSLAFLAVFFIVTQAVSGEKAYAANWPPLQEVNCTCCHYSLGVSNIGRHHLLVVSPEIGCLSCHSFVWNQDIEAWGLDPVKDCLVCHTEVIADRHHAVPGGAPVGNCFPCHQSRWENNAYNIVLKYNCDIPLYGTVQGQVLDTYGNPMENVEISTPSHDSVTAFTDVNGNYSMQAFTLDYSSFRAKKDFYSLGESGPVTVTDGSTTVVNFEIAPTGMIRGVIRDTVGNRLENAYAALDGTGIYTLTNEEGTFSLYNVPIGSNSITFGKNAGDYQITTEVVDVAEGVITMVNAVLPSNGEICHDGVDNDMNGYADCQDPHCRHLSSCQEICNDGIDNNDNDIVDCFDEFCMYNSFCWEDCRDGIDNDGDTKFDCDDEFCMYTGDCMELICDDWIDSDRDGLVDCEDSDDCSKNCPVSEFCNDDVDNDGDLMIDCADSDCAPHPACNPESNCTDEFDEDYDGYMDCADTDCDGDPACLTEIICNNGLDEDVDGLTDCEDPDCDGFVGDPTVCGDGECSATGNLTCTGGIQVDTCTSGAPGTEGPFDDPTCSDSLDNDCDNVTDAADPDCQGDIDCTTYGTKDNCLTHPECKWNKKKGCMNF